MRSAWMREISEMIASSVMVLPSGLSATPARTTSQRGEPAFLANSWAAT